MTPDQKTQIEKEFDKLANKAYEFRGNFNAQERAFIKSFLFDQIEQAEQKGYNQGRIRCLQQHGLEKEIQEAEQKRIEEILEMIKEMENYIAPDCSDPFLVEQGYSQAIIDLQNLIRKHYGM